MRIEQLFLTLYSFDSLPWLTWGCSFHGTNANPRNFWTPKWYFGWIMMFRYPWNTAVLLSMFSYISFKCWRTRVKCLNSWNGYQKLYIWINWFRGCVQGNIFAVEHENWMKMSVYVLNRQLITCLQNMF